MVCPFLVGYESMGDRATIWRMWRASEFGNPRNCDVTPAPTPKRFRTPSTIAAIFCLASLTFSAFDYTKGKYSCDELKGELRHRRPCASKPVSHVNAAPNVSQRTEWAT